MKDFVIFNPIIKFSLPLGLSFVEVVFVSGFVCLFVQVLLAIGFVCMGVCRPYVWHGVCVCVCLSSLCLAWGLSVCLLVGLMFADGWVICNKYS